MHLNQCDVAATTPLHREATTAAPRSAARAAVVVNSTKFAHPVELIRFRARVDQEFRRHGWIPPLWFPTTAATRGGQEARRAAAAGVYIVLAAGGDGTIRTVAQELMGTGLPLGLLPAGTGNLLARNLGVPHNDAAAAVRMICEGQDRAVDAGWLELDRTGDGTYTERYPFLVMAGTGFDAAMMAGAGQKMKQRLGHAAYLVSGARALGRVMEPTTLRVDGRLVLSQPSQGVIVGNCGTLTMGLSLMPEADPSDGMLDGVVLLPRSISAWARVAWAVGTRNPHSHAAMPRVRGRGIEVRSETPQPVQADGELMGLAYGLRINVQRAGLIVRCHSVQPPGMVGSGGSMCQQTLEPHDWTANEVVENTPVPV